MPCGVLYCSVNTILQFASSVTPPLNLYIIYHVFHPVDLSHTPYSTHASDQSPVRLLESLFESAASSRPRESVCSRARVALQHITCAGLKILINHEPWSSDWFPRNIIIIHTACITWNLYSEIPCLVKANGSWRSSGLIYRVKSASMTFSHALDLIAIHVHSLLEDRERIENLGKFDKLFGQSIVITST